MYALLYDIACVCLNAWQTVIGKCGSKRNVAGKKIDSCPSLIRLSTGYQHHSSTHTACSSLKKADKIIINCNDGKHTTEFPDTQLTHTHTHPNLGQIVISFLARQDYYCYHDCIAILFSSLHQLANTINFRCR